MGEDILAAVLAHEMGHIVNGDLDRLHEQTARPLGAGADEFGVRLLAEAGYRPRASGRPLECLGVLRQARDTPRGQLSLSSPIIRSRSFGSRGSSSSFGRSRPRRPRARSSKLSDRTRLVRQRKPRPLDRNGQERTSKNRVERFSAHLDAQTYLERPLEESSSFSSAISSPPAETTPRQKPSFAGLRAYKT